VLQIKVECADRDQNNNGCAQEINESLFTDRFSFLLTYFLWLWSLLSFQINHLEVIVGLLASKRKHRDRGSLGIHGSLAQWA
jgi:hypothetical protein